MSKSKWRSNLDRIRCYSPIGSRYKYDYESKYTERGARYLVKKKEEINIYDMIQAYRPSCDLKYLIARFKQVGDPEIFNQREGFYGDMENMPKDRTEMLQMINKANEDFAKFSPEIREKFNNNVEEFIASIGSDYFYDVFGISKEAEELVVEKEGEVNE